MKTVPTPKTSPYLQLLNWIFRPLEYMEANFQRCGDLFLARWGMLEWILVSHPDALKTILTQDSGDVVSAPGEVSAILKPLLGDNSVILQSGDKHRQRRKLIMPPFHGERLKVYADLIQNITRSLMGEMRDGQTFQARDLTQKLAMRVILQAVFGLHEGDRYRRLETLLAERLDMLSSPIASTLIFFPALQRNYGAWSPGAKIAQQSQEIDSLLYAEIKARRASLDPTRKDILSLLLLAKDDAGNGLTDEELRDELMTLLVAGHETTATALAWSLYWTHHHPQIKEKVRQEIEADGAIDNAIALTKLPYLEAVCNETLRIYPVAMLTFGRMIHQPITLLDYTLDEPGRLLVGCIYLLHRREDLYPQPQEFRPERFLERQYSAYEFMPFGGGARRCIGYALAMYELKIALGTLLTHYDLEMASDRPVRPERRGLTLGMKGGVEMVFKGKRSVPTPAMV
ncbi:cytochrome P450 [Oscillatoria sp. CS-180]|uniref:cytochrome P450 n=1 Tax=Oscillatoria sp. CS-180 TaxID=3021720 RepID=UPI00232C43E5|nr:cytochrome P450 [Oscillatoria sp. CS-180]MDB9526880.1 cytochrome P450 [Oscillatoria sp. CS-180]